MNQKNLRVKNLIERGVIKIDRIARKIGYGNPPDPAGIDRVIDAVKDLGLDMRDGPDGPFVFIPQEPDGVNLLHEHIE